MGQVKGGRPMKLFSLAILAALAATPVTAQERITTPPPQLHAINPSMSLSAPANNPLQEQMRQDYATGLAGAKRDLLQQNPRGSAAKSRRSAESSTATCRVSRGWSHPDATEGSRVRPRNGSAGWNRLPSRVALGYVGVVARGIGTIVPRLSGVRLAVVVAVIWIVIWIVAPIQAVVPPPAVASVVPGMLPVTPAITAEAFVQPGDATVKCSTMKRIAAKSTAVKAAAVKAAAVKAAAVKAAAVKAAAVKAAAVKAAAVKAAKSTAMKSTTMKSAAAVEAPSASMGCVGETWLAKNGRAQQRSCNTHRRPSLSGPGSAIG
jgi:hypothetical protein